MPTPFVPLYIIRHGETDWNVAGRWQGHTDIPLNDRGRGQARDNGRKLATYFADNGVSPQHFDYITSPLGRAFETMQLVQAHLETPVRTVVEPRLKELGFGAWEGHTWGEVEAKDPTATTRRTADPINFAPVNGESYAMVRTRVQAALAALVRPSVIVTHGGVVRVLRMLMLDLEPLEATRFPVPQDKILVLGPGEENWI